VLQQNELAPLRPADGALAGLFAGIAGAFVYLLLSIPITILLAPMERVLMQRVFENAGSMPPEFRDYVGTYVGGGIQVALGFIFMLFVGSAVSTLGGVLGVAIFKRPMPPPAIS
jgi:hypothetical protein